MKLLKKVRVLRFCEFLRFLQKINSILRNCENCEWRDMVGMAKAIRAVPGLHPLSGKMGLENWTLGWVKKNRFRGRVDGMIRHDRSHHS